MLRYPLVCNDQQVPERKVQGRVAVLLHLYNPKFPAQKVVENMPPTQKSAASGQSVILSMSPEDLMSIHLCGVRPRLVNTMQIVAQLPGQIVSVWRKSASAKHQGTPHDKISYSSSRFTGFGSQTEMWGVAAVWIAGLGATRTVNVASNQ